MKGEYMSEDITLKTMRYMEWERSKGSLKAILQTYWKNTVNHAAMKEVIEEFIKIVEKEGYIE